MRALAIFWAPKENGAQPTSGPFTRYLVDFQMYRKLRPMFSLATPSSAPIAPYFAFRTCKSRPHGSAGGVGRRVTRFTDSQKWEDEVPTDGYLRSWRYFVRDTTYLRGNSVAINPPDLVGFLAPSALCLVPRNAQILNFANFQIPFKTSAFARN